MGVLSENMNVKSEKIKTQSEKMDVLSEKETVRPRGWRPSARCEMPCPRVRYMSPERFDVSMNSRIITPCHDDKINIS